MRWHEPKRLRFKAEDQSKVERSVFISGSFDIKIKEI